MSGMRILAITAAVVALAAGGADAATTSQTAATNDTVTVTGTGMVNTVPDQASFDFTVQTKDKTASAALSENGTDTEAVISAVEAAGVPEANIQTQQVSLDPLTSSDGTTIIGYTASNTITVSKLAIGKSGAIVDAAVGAGATDVSGPTLDVSSQDSLYADALKAAVEQARSKAAVLAEATGHTLGEAITVVEGSASTPVPFAVGAGTNAPGSTPVEAGTQQIQATVTVTYSLS
jgi:uncharacterized protein